jgi:hypothetical protein
MMRNFLHTLLWFSEDFPLIYIVVFILLIELDMGDLWLGKCYDSNDTLNIY